MNGHVAARKIDLYARICGNVKRLHVEVIREEITNVFKNPSDVRIVNLFADEIHDDHNANEAEDADNEKNFARRDPTAGAALPVCDGALVKFYQAPNDENERPPVA